MKSRAGSGDQYAVLSKSSKTVRQVPNKPSGVAQTPTSMPKSNKQPTHSLDNKSEGLRGMNFVCQASTGLKLPPREVRFDVCDKVSAWREAGNTKVQP